MVPNSISGQTLFFQWSFLFHSLTNSMWSTSLENKVQLIRMPNFSSLSFNILVPWKYDNWKKGKNNHIWLKIRMNEREISNYDILTLLKNVCRYCEVEWNFQMFFVHYVSGLNYLESPMRGKRRKGRGIRRLNWLKFDH